MASGNYNIFPFFLINSFRMSRNIIVKTLLIVLLLYMGNIFINSSFIDFFLLISIYFLVTYLLSLIWGAIHSYDRYQTAIKLKFPLKYIIIPRAMNIIFYPQLPQKNEMNEVFFNNYLKMALSPHFDVRFNFISILIFICQFYISMRFIFPINMIMILISIVYLLLFCLFPFIDAYTTIYLNTYPRLKIISKYYSTIFNEADRIRKGQINEQYDYIDHFIQTIDNRLKTNKLPYSKNINNINIFWR